MGYFVFSPFALGSRLDWAEGDDGSFVWWWCHTRNDMFHSLAEFNSEGLR